MSETAALQRLLTWLSPAFPVGAFAWSAGLETAIADRIVTDRGTAADWIAGTLEHGGLKTDAILLAQAHRHHADPTTLRDLAHLCLALTPACERHAETATTGAAFAAAMKAWPSPVLAYLPDPCPYPIAVGAAAADHAIGRKAALTAFLTAQVQSQVSAAVRLVPIGQTDGLAILAALEASIATSADRLSEADIEDIGTIAYAADIAQMRHQTLTTRIFRS